eukprot:3646281-Rhodomonas_salina.3
MEQAVNKFQKIFKRPGGESDVPKSKRRTEQRAETQRRGRSNVPKRRDADGATCRKEETRTEQRGAHTWREGTSMSMRSRFSGSRHRASRSGIALRQKRVETCGVSIEDFGGVGAASSDLRADVSGGLRRSSARLSWRNRIPGAKMGACKGMQDANLASDPLERPVVLCFDVRALVILILRGCESAQSTPPTLGTKRHRLHA